MASLIELNNPDKTPRICVVIMFLFVCLIGPNTGNVLKRSPSSSDHSGDLPGGIKASDSKSKNIMNHSGLDGQTVLSNLGLLVSSAGQPRMKTLDTPDDNTSNFNGNTDNGFSESIKSSLALSGLKTAFDNNDTIASACLNDTLRLTAGLPSKIERWQIPFLDSWGKPGPSLTQGRVNFVGNFDQCRKSEAPPSGERAGFKGKYFTLQAKTEIFNISLQIKIGICFPDTCSGVEIEGMISNALKGRVSSATVQSLRTGTEMTIPTIIAIILLSVIGGLVFLGTIVDVFMIQQWARTSSLYTESHPQTDYNTHGESYQEKRKGSGEASPLLSKETTKQPTTSSFSDLVKPLVIFSVYTNGKKILSTARTSGSLESIHGIRFLSMTWVVLGHTYIFGAVTNVNFISSMTTYLHRRSFDAVANALVSVDTFFSLSGLLVSYLTLKKLRHENTWKVNWAVFYLHRIWRLTPPYAAVLVTTLGLQQYMGQGPLWQDDEEVCAENWWTNLLYVNNFVHPDKLCMLHSWFLANDMQFYILSPLMIIPLYIHPFVGVLCCSIFLIATWTATGVLSSVHHWSTYLVSGGSRFFIDYYMKPWCRMGPFVIGILAGAILAEVKGRPFRLKWWIIALGWVLATASALAVVYGIHGDISGDDLSSNAVAALYNAVSRSVWGACVCWVIVACEMGYGGPVAVLLSWSPFSVLGRLTYMTYLIHPFIMKLFFQNMGVLYYSNDTTEIVYFLGICTSSYLIAFVLMLGFESPMIGLEKMLSRKSVKK